MGYECSVHMDVVCMEAVYMEAVYVDAVYMDAVHMDVIYMDAVYMDVVQNPSFNIIIIITIGPGRDREGTGHLPVQLNEGRRFSIAPLLQGNAYEALLVRSVHGHGSSSLQVVHI